MANAESFQITYDIKSQKEVSFAVTVSSNKVIIDQKSYTLRVLGTLTNSNIEFNSYCYGENDRMFCVSTSEITVEKDQFTKFFGYLIFIDDKVYFADKIK
ncbi:MAG: hypothetical protein ACRCZY_06395 [Phocaeicola sp.]